MTKTPSQLQQAVTPRNKTSKLVNRKWHPASSVFLPLAPVFATTSNATLRPSVSFSGMYYLLCITQDFYLIP